jgi:hypothetical protein
MAGGTFRLEHIMHVVDKVSSSTQFPLADAAALEAALGGNTTDLSRAGSHDAVTWDFALVWR